MGDRLRWEERKSAGQSFNDEVEDDALEKTQISIEEYGSNTLNSISLGEKLSPEGASERSAKAHSVTSSLKFNNTAEWYDKERSTFYDVSSDTAELSDLNRQYISPITA